MRFAALVLLLSAGCTLDAPAVPADAGGGVWRTATPLPFERFEGYATTVGGKIFFLGGITGVYGNDATVRELDDVVVYDPATDRWTNGPRLPAEGPKHHLTVAVVDERIYVLGGFIGTIGADPTQTFHPNPRAYVLEGGATGAWRALAPQPLARGAATAQAIGTKIYVTGGGDDEKRAHDELWVYDVPTDGWTQKAPMPTPRQHLASCVVGGRMLAVGGWFSDALQTVSAVQAYDPVTNAWELLPDLPTSRGGLGAVTLGDRCWAIGGEEWHGALPGTFSAVEVYDPVARAWTEGPPMPTTRHGIGVALLDGAIWVAGGGPVRGNSYTSRVEVFRP